MSQLSSSSSGGSPLQTIRQIEHAVALRVQRSLAFRPMPLLVLTFFDRFVPSIIIALSVAAAFAAGRLLGSIRRGGLWIRVGVVVLSLWFAADVIRVGGNPYALLLPAALMAGCFSHRRGGIAPGVFDDREQ